MSNIIPTVILGPATAIAVALALALSGCSPGPEALEQTLREHPELAGAAIETHLKAHPGIVFRLMEENPEAFMAAANRAMQAKQQLEQERTMGDALSNPLVPQIAPDRVVFGNPDAPVTIVEYSDFECPYCARVSPVLSKVLEDYGNQVRVVYKHLPLDFHPLARPAARYFEAIGLQDPAMARAFHDTLFSDRQALSRDGEAFMYATAEALGADMDRLRADLDSDAVSERIAADEAEAAAFGITGTPGFVINGVALSGAQPYDAFKSVIDRHLKSG